MGCVVGDGYVDPAYAAGLEAYYQICIMAINELGIHCRDLHEHSIEVWAQKIRAKTGGGEIDDLIAQYERGVKAHESNNSQMA